MKEVTYTIQDAQGIHARPAGLLVKKLKEFTATPTLTKGEKTIDPRKMFALMGLGIKCGESITFTLDGRLPYQLFKDRVKVIHIANTNLRGNLAGAQAGGQQKMLCLPDAAAV